MKRVFQFFNKLPPARLLSLGFAAVIAAGALLLALPVSHNAGIDVAWIDALFTSTSAVCVTGLISVDTADTFSVFGRVVVALLIQIGGLGVTSVGVGIILLARKRVSMKERLLVRETMATSTMRGAVKLVKNVLLLTLCFEAAGAVLSFFVFVRDYSPLQALGISVFHSIAAFNNSGFDILGGLRNLIPYREDVLLNLTTCALVFFGGIGFLVILDCFKKRSLRRLALHSKVVLSTSAVLIVLGTLLLRLTEDISWLGAFFHSVSARTAGFSTYPLGTFSSAGLFTLTILMFIGASPGSTGGGIKTSTLFALIQATKSAATNRPCSAFRRGIAREVVYQAFVITLLAALVVVAGTFALCLLEPEYTFLALLFEVTSAFGTVGLSTGITPELCVGAMLVLVFLMVSGRLGPVTIASLWSFRAAPQISYSEEEITIG